MNAFENVIGYDSLKIDLEELLDCVNNPEAYEKLGVKYPKGILLYGEPGVGKTLIAKSFIDASGREAVICRKNASEQSFVDSICGAFDKACACAPSVILLDDMDKFANNDKHHKDSEAFVTIQTCIDLVRDEDVIVIATANDIEKLPDSLIRTGRFDRKIEVDTPSLEESKAIICHYLAGKDLGEHIDIDAIAHLFGGHECSMLESAINQAGLLAGYRRSSRIEMDDLVKAYLIVAHDIPKESLIPSETDDLYKNDGSIDVCWHEAGHVVINELLNPGSVSIAIAISSASFERGFVKGDTHRTPSNKLKSLKDKAMVSLGSAAAIDVVFGRVDPGAYSDVSSALADISKITEDLGGFSGLGLATLGRDSDTNKVRLEAANSIIAELYFQETKEMLCANRDFLETVARLLATRTVLTARDITEIRGALNISAPKMNRVA